MRRTTRSKLPATEAGAVARQDKAGLAREPDRAEAAQYISEMIIGLRRLSSSAHMPMLTYLLDMAYEEAVGNADSRGRTDEAADVGLVNDQRR